MNGTICEPLCKKNLHMAFFQCKDFSFGFLYFFYFVLISLSIGFYEISMSRSRLWHNLLSRLNPPSNKIFKIGLSPNYQYLVHAYNTFDEALKAITSIRIIWRPGVFFVTSYDRNNSHSPKKTFRIDTVSDFVLVWGVNLTSWTQQYDYFCLRGCLCYREEKFWNWFLLM